MEDLDNFVRSNVPRRCTLKSGMIEYSARARALEVERLGKARLIVQSPGGPLLFYNMNGPDSSWLGRSICDNKNHFRSIARMAGVPVVRSSLFFGSEAEKGLEYATQLGWPVVVKPVSLSRGRGVTAGISSEAEFRRAWRHAGEAYRRGAARNRKILVEEHIHGEDFRVFIADGKVVSVTHRARAHVVGDGRSTLIELVKLKNKERADNVYLSGYPLPEDAEVIDTPLVRQRGLHYRPAAGERVDLRTVSNLSAGGDSVDLTGEASPDFLDHAVRAVAAIPGLPYAGVDIITPDIRRLADGAKFVVGEVEFSPAPITHFPWRGPKRDMGGAILGHYLKV